MAHALSEVSTMQSGHLLPTPDHLTKRSDQQVGEGRALTKQSLARATGHALSLPL
jgi:hypothetical protein